MVGEFGAQLPMADRIGIYQAIYDEILDAATDGLPAAGKERAKLMGIEPEVYGGIILNGVSALYSP